MSALTKSEMADKLFEELGLNKREAKELVEQFFEEIRICLENNEQVKLSGFGNFDLQRQASAAGKKPENGRSHTHIGPQSGHISTRSKAQGKSRAGN